MAGDVGDKESGAVVVDGEIFVEVAGDLGHRLVHRCDAEVADLWCGSRENGELQLARDGEFVLDGREAALARIDLLHGDVGQRKQKSEKAKVVPDGVCAKAQRTAKVGVEGLKAEDERTRDDDTAIAEGGVASCQARNDETYDQDYQAGGGDEVVGGTHPVLTAGKQEAANAEYGDYAGDDGEDTRELA